jgi:hypothetical protein
LQLDVSHSFLDGPHVVVQRSFRMSA